jgi:hypothetical protein
MQQLRNPTLMAHADGRGDRAAVDSRSYCDTAEKPGPRTGLIASGTEFHCPGLTLQTRDVGRNTVAMCPSQGTTAHTAEGEEDGSSGVNSINWIHRLER